MIEYIDIWNFVHSFLKSTNINDKGCFLYYYPVEEYDFLDLSFYQSKTMIFC